MLDAMNVPQGYKLLTSEDGSPTLYSERFGEACHSTHGARAETLLHYIEGCRIRERAQAAREFRILEVGFGTGLGLLCTREALEGLPVRVHFVSLEIDPALVEWFFSNHPQLKDDPKFTTEVLVGDARRVLPEWLSQPPLRFDAIYQDAFSPKRNPDLWTREWFELLRTHAAPDCIMSTYSSSSSIRKSMLEAGWKLYAGEKFGPKRSSTRARISGDTDPEILLQLSRSPARALRDADFLKGEK
jgi:tRNA U34 5-methylaminomethyl-2-thiouridine-forming methyltransferase MnmC